MYHETHIGFVNSHPKGNRGDNNLHIIPRKRFLVAQCVLLRGSRWRGNTRTALQATHEVRCADAITRPRHQAFDTTTRSGGNRLDLQTRRRLRAQRVSNGVFRRLLERRGDLQQPVPVRAGSRQPTGLQAEHRPDLPQAHLDAVRPGIALYGLYPSSAVARHTRVERGASRDTAERVRATIA